MDPNRIYFTWPDGRFSYECGTCGACCRGLGIGLDAAGGQIDELLGHYPGLAAFLRRRGSAWTAFNPRGQCWFLTDDGLCRIESEHGRTSKPASCRLFPFNRIFRLGEWTIVDYNSVICPLAVADAASEDAVRHDAVVADIRATRDAAIIGTELPVQAKGDDRRFVTRERAIATACFQAAAAEVPDVAAAWLAQAKDGTFPRARARLSSALEVMLGSPWRAPTGATLRAALWLTPSMRFNELYGPRHYCPRPELSSVLADMWLVWLHFLAVGAQLAGRDLGLREATSVWSEQAPLCYLAARSAQAPTLESGEFEFPGEADSARVVRAFAQACIDNRLPRRPLSEILPKILEPLATSERIAHVRVFEPLFAKIRWRRCKKK